MLFFVRMKRTRGPMVRLIITLPSFHARVSQQNPSPVGYSGSKSTAGECHSRQLSKSHLFIVRLPWLSCIFYNRFSH
ncbi:MAG: hypothetical protein J2P48_19020, partial [Alphaproteobacteria bacterium]|nr:hypothetical protein [Alphaproteobacteria bacterium]